MADERTQYGGQAVVEGVMMRSPRFFAVACRRLSTNEIVTQLEPVEKHLRGVQWLNRPFLRGSLALIDAMALGIKALTYAANVQSTDAYARAEAPASGAVGLAMGEGAVERARSSDGTINGIAIGITTVLSLVLGFGLFWTLPAFLTAYFLPGASVVGKNLAEGAVRLAIFFLYITAISRMKHIQRVFQYHGAEHKAINTLESGLPVTLENARAASRIHPRCGTNFIFIVLITSVFVFALGGALAARWLPQAGAAGVLTTVALRLVLLPLVAGVAFEILKWAGANRAKPWALWLIAPGLWTQTLTTRVPDDAQIEVALASLDAVWRREHAGVGLVPASLASSSAEAGPDAPVVA